mgnify:FL=1
MIFIRFIIYKGIIILIIEYHSNYFVIITEYYK